ncbi:hemolysin III family protein [Xanthomonas oryzae pv. oryzae]|nr:hemolysin III family protein [Xanthomonas oryzae pv. oryzae]
MGWRFGADHAGRHPWRWLALATAIVFSATLVLLYVASTLFHAIAHPGAKARLQVLDHCAIYLLIAGTYTPFTLINLRGPWGWGLFAAVWDDRRRRSDLQDVFTGRFRLLSTVLYLAMGWLIIVAIQPLLRSVDTWSLYWLLAGGLFYTLGTYFYQRDNQRYFHAIWHLFVLAGSTCHFVAVIAQVM